MFFFRGEARYARPQHRLFAAGESGGGDPCFPGILDFFRKGENRCCIAGKFFVAETEDRPRAAVFHQPAVFRQQSEQVAAHGDLVAQNFLVTAFPGGGEREVKFQTDKTPRPVQGFRFKSRLIFW